MLGCVTFVTSYGALESQSKHFVGMKSGRSRTGVLRDRQWEGCGRQLLRYFVVNSKPVIYIYEVASIVIQCRVYNYKLKNAVGCKCGL